MSGDPEWRCVGCGAVAPRLIKNCECVTDVVGSGEVGHRTYKRAFAHAAHARYPHFPPDAAQALAEAEAEVGRLRGAVIAALGTYDTALSAATFTKPRTGQVILNVKTVERLNETLKAALTTHPAQPEGEGHE